MRPMITAVGRQRTRRNPRGASEVVDNEGRPGPSPGRDG